MKLILSLLLSLTFISIANAEQFEFRGSFSKSEKVIEFLHNAQLLPESNHRWPSLADMKHSYSKKTGKEMPQDIQNGYEILASLENSQIKGAYIMMASDMKSPVNLQDKTRVQQIIRQALEKQKSLEGSR